MTSPPDTRPRTVVMLQYTGIGDVIWHIPYFEAIARTSQGGRITLMAQPSTQYKVLLAGQTWIDDFIDHDYRPRLSDQRRGQHSGLKGMLTMARTLREQDFERIVLFSGRASRGLLAALSGIPRRLGYGYRFWQRIFLTEGPYIQPHTSGAVEAYPEASAFCVAHGFCDAPIVPRFAAPEALLNEMQARLKHLPRPLYALAIGTSETRKQWGEQNFAQLATALCARGAGVVLLGGPQERQLAQNIFARIPPSSQHQVHVLTDAPLLGSVAALHVVDACVGNDTGMIQISAAAAKPTYALLGNRPRLDHDPLMVSLLAPTLAHVTVEQVLDAMGMKPFPSGGPSA
jgi:heptosyltransferase II